MQLRVVAAVGLTALTSACAANAAASSDAAPATVAAPVTPAGAADGPPAAPPTTEPPAPAPPSTVAASTTVPTTVAPTTVPPSTAPPSTAATSALPPRAAVWESAVDPTRVNISANHPIGSADGIASGIDMVAVTPAGSATALGRTCLEVAAATGVAVSECLVVQFRFHVEPGFATHASAPHAELRRIRAVTRDGTEVISGYGKWALAGTYDNTLTILLPGVAEGATIYWSTGSTLVGYTEFSGAVPGLIAPVDWLGQPATTTTTVAPSPSPAPASSAPATTAPPNDH